MGARSVKGSGPGLGKEAPGPEMERTSGNKSTDHEVGKATLIAKESVHGSKAPENHRLEQKDAQI